MKPWVKTEIVNHCDQIIGIQPTPEMEDCIEFFFYNEGETKSSGILYINKDELPVLIQKMNQMMNYVNTEK